MTKIENLIYSYANPDDLAKEKEKELGKQLKNKFLGIFKKEAVPEYNAEETRQKLSLRIKKHMKLESRLSGIHFWTVHCFGFRQGYECT